MTYTTRTGRLWGGILRFLFPWACAGCRCALETLEDSGFCGRCWLMIPRIDGLVCQACGLPLKDGGESCYSCRSTPSALLTRAAALYKHPLQNALHRYKYAGRKSLTPLFRVLLDYAWTSYPELHDAEVIVPVPLHKTTAYNRGYNQAHLLAQALVSIAALPVWDGLQRVRKTAPQFRLSKMKRLTNLQGAFSIHPKANKALIEGKRILLVDDVCTTGTTLLECAKVLKKAGVHSLKALVLARDP